MRPLFISLQPHNPGLDICHLLLQSSLKESDAAEERMVIDDCECQVWSQLLAQVALVAGGKFVSQEMPLQGNHRLSKTCAYDLLD